MNDTDYRLSVNGLPDGGMEVGQTVQVNMQAQDGGINRIWIADETIAKISQQYYQNAWGAGMVIQAVSAGTTTLNVEIGNTVRSFEIKVLGGGTTATTQTTATTTTTTTSTTETTTTTTTTTTETTTTPDNQETETKTLGDINRDDQVDASDAAAVLVAAAKVGSGNPSGLSKEQERDADVDGSGDFDAQDAALILRYAAAVGSGYKGSLTAYLKSVS